MLVGLSLLTLVPGISGGSETYARELARALARIGRHEYVVLAPPLAPDAGDGLRTIVADGYPTSTTTAGRLRAMGSARLRPARLRALIDGVDVVHYPLTVPVPPPTQPHVITLHDIQHLDLPELFPRGERLFRRLAYDHSARAATDVIVVSEFVRERAVERLGLAPEHVHAVWLGVDHDRFTASPDVQREPLLLYPARPWSHKNHARLFEAFAQIRSRRPELRLVLTGAGHDRRSLPEGVEAHAVSDAELVDLYRRASCLVFPSLYEGFGLPPVEAMACGCPVAAAAAGSLPEVCGDAAVLFDPLDPEAIAAGVDEALARSDELTERGLRRAAAFSWDETARAHGLEHRGDADGGELCRLHRLIPRAGDEGRRCEVEDLRGTGAAEGLGQGALAQEIGPDEGHTVGEPGERVGVRLRRASHDAEDLVPVLEQKLCEERAVLAADPGYQRAPVSVQERICP